MEGRWSQKGYVVSWKGLDLGGPAKCFTQRSAHPIFCLKHRCSSGGELPVQGILIRQYTKTFLHERFSTRT